MFPFSPAAGVMTPEGARRVLPTSTIVPVAGVDRKVDGDRLHVRGSWEEHVRSLRRCLTARQDRHPQDGIGRELPVVDPVADGGGADGARRGDVKPDRAVRSNLRRAQRRIRGGDDRDSQRVAVGLVVVEEHVDVDDITADHFGGVVSGDRRPIQWLEHRQGHRGGGPQPVVVGDLVGRDEVADEGGGRGEREHLRAQGHRASAAELAHRHDRQIRRGVSGSASLASTSNWVATPGPGWTRVVDSDRRHRLGLAISDRPLSGRDATGVIADLVSDLVGPGRSGSDLIRCRFDRPSRGWVGGGQHGQPRTRPVGVAVVGEDVDRHRAECLRWSPSRSPRAAGRSGPSARSH